MTRAEAKKCGLKCYDGKSCVLGHGSQRFVANKRCVICSAANVAAWRENNREYCRLVTVQWRKDNPERSLAGVYSWRKNNPEHNKRLNKAWRQRNPDKTRARGTARYARKLGAKGKYTAADVQVLVKRQGNCCATCGVSFVNATRNIDHKTPLSRGGSNYPRNLQLLCQPCNDRKGVKTMREWQRAA